jgi:hypothetical protein
MEINSSDGAFVFFKAVDYCSYSVIPELDCAVVEGSADPRADGVEG